MFTLSASLLDLTVYMNLCMHAAMPLCIHMCTYANKCMHIWRQANMLTSINPIIHLFIQASASFVLFWLHARQLFLSIYPVCHLPPM
jgi:hypothetical protein